MEKNLLESFDGVVDAEFDSPKKIHFLFKRMKIANRNEIKCHISLNYQESMIFSLLAFENNKRKKKIKQLIEYAQFSLKYPFYLISYIPIPYRISLVKKINKKSNGTK